MSTRCTTHFHDRGNEKACAIIFRHTDGYPAGAGADIREFFDAVDEQSPDDTRFNDASMLAARYVVFLSQMFVSDPAKPLAFLSVRVLDEDTADTEFTYHVYCEGGRPRVMVDGGKVVTLQEALDGAFNDEDDED